MKKSLEMGLFENLGRRNRTKMNNKASAMPSQRFADRANKLAAMMPTIKEMEIHTNGMDGIVH
jgi:hypothetical protein